MTASASRLFAWPRWHRRSPFASVSPSRFWTICGPACIARAGVRVLENGGWKGGSDPDYLDALIGYWRDEYDWRRHERELNQLAHFVADIDDARVHYIHEPGLSVRSVPVLMLHGWPDSFLRYRLAIPLLAGAQDDYADDLTCDVVVPSLPGFAFTGQVGPAVRSAVDQVLGAAPASPDDRSARL